MIVVWATEFSLANTLSDFMWLALCQILACVEVCVLHLRPRGRDTSRDG